jgi:hypothetical protein
VYQKREIHRGFSVRARHFIYLAICIAGFLLPCHAGQAEEGAGACLKPHIKSIFPWAARPGDLVTIQGERFGMPQGEVVFAEKPGSTLEQLLGAEVKAKIVNWTFHRIWVIVPKSAATGYIFVKVHCGEESNKMNFTVNK